MVPSVRKYVWYSHWAYQYGISTNYMVRTKLVVLIIKNLASNTTFEWLAHTILPVGFLHGCIFHNFFSILFYFKGAANLIKVKSTIKMLNKNIFRTCELLSRTNCTFLPTLENSLTLWEDPIWISNIFRKSSSLGSLSKW